MWPFASESTRKKLRDIEDQLETLKRENRNLRAEWDDAYDKMRTLTARFVKRAQRIEQSEQAEETESATPTGIPTVTSHLDPMSKRILERRARMFPARKEAQQ